MGSRAISKRRKGKGGALAASERRPRSVRKALKEMKTSISNQRAVLGRTLSASARQVAFDDEVLVRAIIANNHHEGG